MGIYERRSNSPESDHTKKLGQGANRLNERQLWVSNSETTRGEIIELRL